MQRANKLSKDAAYMKKVCLPDILDGLVTELLASSPGTRLGVLQTLKNACQKLIDDVDGEAKPKTTFNEDEPRKKRLNQNTQNTLSLALKNVPRDIVQVENFVMEMLNTVASQLPSGFVLASAQKWKPAASLKQNRRCTTARHPVFKVVFTGGPCAGKSTGMSMVRTKLEKFGYNVFIVPEAATLLIDGGAGLAFQDSTMEKTIAFQLSLLKLQVKLEESYVQIARACRKPSVILCDRGAMDGKAFCTDGMWETLLKEGRWTTGELRDSRYDLVLHLVTAADGAVEHYTTENNSARTETPEQAIEQDLKLQEMWLGHPRHRIVDNSTNFEGKISRATANIMQLVGIDHCKGTIIKYELLNPPNRSDIPVPFHTAHISIHILQSSLKECVYRLYKRTTGACVAYTRQVLKRTQGQVQRIEEGLTERGYNTLLGATDPNVTPLEKMVLNFVSGKQQYELMFNVKDNWKKATLYAETDQSKGVELPLWITSRGGVTNVTNQQPPDRLRLMSTHAHARLSCTSVASDDPLSELSDFTDFNTTANWMLPAPTMSPSSEVDISAHLATPKSKTL